MARSQDADADLAGKSASRPSRDPLQRGPVSARCPRLMETALGAFGSVECADQQRRRDASRSSHLGRNRKTRTECLRSIDINFKGVYNGMRAGALPVIRRTRRWVNPDDQFGCRASRHPKPGAIYARPKAAVNRWGGRIHLEIAANGIRATPVAGQPWRPRCNARSKQAA